MLSVKRILIAILVSLVVLIIMVSLGFNAVLFFKCVELKEIVERQGREDTRLRFNRGRYLDLKTTIEEQRKEIIRLGERSDLCLEKLERTIDDLERRERFEGSSGKNLNEKNILD